MNTEKDAKIVELQNVKTQLFAAAKSVQEKNKNLMNELESVQGDLKSERGKFEEISKANADLQIQLENKSKEVDALNSQLQEQTEKNNLQVKEVIHFSIFRLFY